MVLGKNFVLKVPQVQTLSLGLFWSCALGRPVPGPVPADTDLISLLDLEPFSSAQKCSVMAAVCGCSHWMCSALLIQVLLDCLC